ncbi:MAG: DUF4215 domain-containing protein [Sandaracinus sp.]
MRSPLLSVRALVAFVTLAATAWLTGAPSASAQTMVPGGNIAIQTWTPAGSPYIVQGDITVLAGGSLTIQAGTVVRFASTDGVGSGTDSGRVELIVNGTLAVTGTAAMPVSFAAQTGTSSSAWYGIRAMSGSSVSIAGATIQNASYAVRSENGAPTLDTTTVSNCQSGAYVAGGSATITGTIFTGEADAVRVDSGTATVTSCTLYGNSNAIRAFGGSVVVRNSIVTNNSSYGAYASGASINLVYSDFWQNSNGNFGATTGSGYLQVNPLYVSGSNLRITSSSPCRFAGSTGADIGALPYTGDATPGLYGTLWTDTTVSSPTSVPGDLTIAPGVTLTLAAGATLTFATSDIMGAYADTGRAELRVQGTLVTSGTGASPVTLTSSGTSSSSWYGVVFLPGASGSRLAGLILEEASYGLRVEGGAITSADGMTIRNCQSGTYVVSGGIDVENTIYTGNADAFRVDGGTGSIVGSSTFYGNSNAIRAFGGSVVVRNSIVTNNSSYGAYASGASINLVYSDFWQNSNGNFGATTGSGYLQVNPLYVSGSNLRITSSSPCRFAGSTGADIGALPYTGDATPGLYGTLWTDTTVSSPTSVPGDLTIAPGVTLTLAAGATLTFATSDIMGAYADTGRAELRVQGTLVTSGTGASPVTLTSSGTSSSSWYGVVFLPGASGSRLAGLILEEASYGLRVEGGAITSADGMTIRNCQSGTYVVSGGIDVENTIYTGNADAFRVDGGTGSIVGSSTFYGNSNAIRAFGGSVVVRNSIVTNNSSYGAYASGASINLVYSDFWQNSNGNFGATSGTGMISINPLYVSGSDLHLTATSPCIDAGTATGAPTRDRDGSPRPLDGDGINGAAYDMGAYEYARATVCGDGMLGAGEVCDDGPLNGTYGHCNGMCSGPGPRCGDGMPNGGEQCDDGNAIDTDACTSACLTARCGDGFLRAGVEECDDANTIATDGCTDTCHLAICGDGVVRAGVEQCDDGNAASTDACVSCASAFCGDGYVRAGVEECDDGNASNTDTCTNACHVAICGDGIVGPGETCDDGNGVDTDTCTNRCVPAMCGDGITQAGEECDDGNAVNTDGCTTSCHVPRCGDGFIQMGEVCDDGNMVDTDTCTNACQPARCGDSIVQAGETCDDGNTDPTDGCTSSCLPAVCGDGFVHAGVEACDDGNTSDTDGCIAGCIVASCGDGHLHAGVEACDDGNVRDGDGCSSTCALASCGNGTVDPGEECDDGNLSNLDACLGTCLSARCGDGFVRTGLEACDDGNALDNDACVQGCHVASCGDGFVQAGVETCDDGNADQTDACLVSCESASCGDGFVENGVEECDDSNTMAGDGCSPSCTEEPPPSDAGVPDGGTGDAGATTPDAGMGGDAAMLDASMSPDGGTEAPTTSGGCGCRAAGGGSGGAGALGLGLMLALWIARRRTR